MYRYVHLAVFVHVLVLFMNSMAQSQYTPLPLPLVAIWQSMINDQRSVELLNTSKFIKQRLQCGRGTESLHSTVFSSDSGERAFSTHSIYRDKQTSVKVVYR